MIYIHHHIRPIGIQPLYGLLLAKSIPPRKRKRFVAKPAKPVPAPKPVQPPLVPCPVLPSVAVLPSVETPAGGVDHSLLAQRTRSRSLAARLIEQKVWRL